MRARITPNTDTLHIVLMMTVLSHLLQNIPNISIVKIGCEIFLTAFQLMKKYLPLVAYNDTLF